MKKSDMIIMAVLVIGLLSNNTKSTSITTEPTPEKSALTEADTAASPIDSSLFQYDVTFEAVDYQRIKAFKQWSQWYDVNLIIKTSDQ